jgi:hypothetical protein
MSIRTKIYLSSTEKASRHIRDALIFGASSVICFGQIGLTEFVALAHSYHRTLSIPDVQNLSRGNIIKDLLAAALIAAGLVTIPFAFKFVNNYFFVRY